MASVTLEGVQKIYEDGVVAVHGVDLEVTDGEFIVLVGPSGCGKSTTLRMIAGLESITAGRLLIGGRMVNDVPPAARDIAMVFQSYALYPHMTVRENMGFALRLRKRPGVEVEQRVRNAATLLGLDELLDRMPRQLSGGQRQRVAIGRALVREPQVFLFDEPLSNLDAKLRGEMRREIAALHRRLGTTMIYVTHDQLEAMTLGDRIVVMNRGSVCQVGTPADVYNHPRDTFVAGFLGSPSMNLIPGTLVTDELGTAVRLDGDPATVVPVTPVSNAGVRLGSAHEVLLGVRPEHVEVVRAEAADAATPRAVVELIEPLGHEQLVHVQLASTPVVIRMAPRPVPPPGDATFLRLDPAYLHLFDRMTGRSLADSTHE